jgi:UDP-N-acetylmuramyl pentapeptide phosphotransferase/UDP-N-acetylglucosamine-1-phosphate transferase
MIFVLLTIFLISFSLNWIIIFLSKKYNLFLDNLHKEHAIHHGNIPRIGGVAIYLSILFYSLLFNKEIFPFILLASISFIAGLIEDLTHKLSFKIRFLLIIIASILAIYPFNLIITDISNFQLPFLIAIPFTIFALTGIANAFNLIDGLNGLSSGIGILVFLFIGLTAYNLGDTFLFNFSLAIIFAILGFFVFNFPFGKIFLGDGGAYLIGFLIGIISILLFTRHKEVSEWYPLILTAYPVIDVLFSIFRRKFIEKKSPFEPDKRHLHTLLKLKFNSNPLASFVLLIISLIFNISGYFYHSNSLFLAIEFAIIFTLYIFTYKFLTKKLNN